MRALKSLFIKLKGYHKLFMLDNLIRTKNGLKFN